MCKSWLLVFCLVAAYGRAQATAPVLTDVAPPSSRFPDNWYPADSDVTYTSAAHRGAPYSATLVTTWQLRDANGETKTLVHRGFPWVEPRVAPGPPKAMVTCMPRTLHYTEQNIYADAITTHAQQISSTPD